MAVLERKEQFRDGLDQRVQAVALDGYRGMTLALPSARRQQEGYALLRANGYNDGGIGPRLMQQSGFPDGFIVALGTGVDGAVFPRELATARGPTVLALLLLRPNEPELQAETT